MKAYVVITYSTDANKDVNVRIPNVPTGTLNEFAIEASANKILTANALRPKHGTLIASKKAVQYVVDTVVLEVV